MKETTNELAESKEKVEEIMNLDDKKTLTPYYLPDGSAIQLSSERFLAPEIMFNPSRIGLEAPSVPDIIHNCLKKTDLDLRKTLYSEIVLTGGNTMIRNFPERLLNEVQLLNPKDVKVIFCCCNQKIVEI